MTLTAKSPAVVAAVLAMLLIGGPGSTPAGAQGAPAKGVPVEVVKIAPKDLTDQLEAVGTLRSNESVVLRPEIAGRVTRILFSEGQPVAAGAPLIDLDASTYEAELAVARSDLKLAQADAERARTLFNQRAGTARAQDEAMARLSSTQAAVALAEAQLAKTHIVAPFGGILGLRQVSVGDVVQPGQTLVNLEAIDPLKLDFSVPEMMLSRLGVGQPVGVTVDALPGRSFTGQVYAINPLVDERGRSVALRATVPNPDGLLKPGLFARVKLTTDIRGAAIIVPEQAIVPRNGALFVFKVTGDSVSMVEVTLGERLVGEVEVLSGVAAGDTIVTAGQQRLRDKAKILIVGPDGTPVASES
jgi:membrane fusion protein (multidrug efflux system)